ncbi:MAG: hypothetical protein NC223_08730 [Butyrivibrio sp.]|nr:hypothetical protein [Butyrivibrio sp.]
MSTDFENIDQKKAKLLRDFMSLSAGKGSDELLPLLLAFSNKARREHISFEKNDISSLFESMKKDMPPEDLSKIETLMKMTSLL